MPFDFACKKIFIVRKFSVIMSKRRREDTREYERRRYDAKKRKRIEEKREKLERCYMDEEDMMMMMMMGMMGMILSRNVDIQECTTYAIGAVEVKTGAILHE